MATQVSRGALALALGALLLAPVALAHVPDARPVVQRAQVLRIVDMQVEGVRGEVTLLQSGEPTQEWIQHVLDPARGVFASEHRRDAAAAEGRFAARWEILRIVEYRDLNHDGRYQPESDTIAKAWRPGAYAWRVATPVQRVQVGGVTGSDVVWEANLSGAPSLRLEAVATGRDFTDEGAFTRAQDVLLYFDVRDLPPRSVGSLFAIEMTATFPQGADAQIVRVGEFDTAAFATHDGRHALLVWGGEALLDGRERQVEATLGAAQTREGAQTHSLILHLPTFDERARFVVVQGVEYDFENKRAPLPLWAGALALLIVVAARRRRA